MDYVTYDLENYVFFPDVLQEIDTRRITNPAQLLGAVTITDGRRLLPAHYSPQIVCASHLRTALDPEERESRVASVVTVLSHFEFDAIAFRGLSGSLMAAPVAIAMNKTLLAVRKPEEESHSCWTVEGDHAARRYVILDDLVASGTTVRAILEEISAVLPHAKCIGMLEYLYVKPWSDESALRNVASVSITIEKRGYDPLVTS